MDQVSVSANKSSLPEKNDLIITHDTLFDLLTQWTEEKSNTRYYFRGENDYNYKLRPSLLRWNNFDRLSDKHNTKEPLELEERLIQRFKRYTSHIYHQNSDFSGRKFQDLEMLCLAQHNGLPTLLIDFTLNPLVALYFALRSHQYEDISTGDEKDAALWVMQLKEKGERKNLTIYLEDEDKDTAEDWRKNYKEQREFRPLLIVPLAFTHRISAQAGRFIYAGFLKPPTNENDNNPETCLDTAAIQVHRFEKVLKPWQSLKKYRIPQGTEERRKLLRTLRFLGIHEGTLLTDLEGWAKYLKDGNL